MLDDLPERKAKQKNGLGLGLEKKHKNDKEI